jgi:phenylacetate-CoA ligase
MNRTARFWNIWRAGRQEPEVLARLQQRRANALVSYARDLSPFYYEHYRRLPQSGYAWQDLPPVTKPLLMDHFDQWATDSAITRAAVDEFVSDPSRVGQKFLDRYLVYVTSGTTGTPGLFLHDRASLGVNELLYLLRGSAAWQGIWRLGATLRPDFCEVLIAATGGHFASFANMEHLRRRYPWLGRRLHTLSVLLPIAELVQQLNTLQPTVLATYPTALTLLAREQQEGWLAIHPLFIITMGEWLAPTAQKEATAAFHCPLREIYGCSEFGYIAFSCHENRLHLNADWVLLEPVDADYKPVPRGEVAHTTLITNLANHTQPLIRYELGDRTAIDAAPCPCGSALPAIRVDGRRDELLTFTLDTGTTVRISPVPLAIVVETTPGVFRYQLIQTGPTTLHVRLEAMPGINAGDVWQAVAGNLERYLAAQGAPAIAIIPAGEPPQRDPRTGKFRHVWQQLG